MGALAAGEKAAVSAVGTCAGLEVGTASVVGVCAGLEVGSGAVLAPPGVKVGSSAMTGAGCVSGFFRNSNHAKPTAKAPATTPTRAPLDWGFSTKRAYHAMLAS